jgi:putative oxidoreductase
MGTFGSEKVREEVLLVARILLAALFLRFGWSKLSNYSGTVAYMSHDGLPLPWLAALIAIMMEFFGSILIILGVLTRPLALLFALYTLATAFIGHPFWGMEGGARMGAMINFYKNVSIIGGFLLLYLTGAGKYSIDARSLSR